MNPKKITESILHVRENWKKSSNYFQNYLFIHLFVNNFLLLSLCKGKVLEISDTSDIFSSS